MKGQLSLEALVAFAALVALIAVLASAQQSLHAKLSAGADLLACSFEAEKRSAESDFLAAHRHTVYTAKSAGCSAAASRALGDLNESQKLLEPV